MRDDIVQQTIDNIGNERHDLHKCHATSRPLSDGYENVGLAGEFEFGKFSGLMPDLERRPGGDNGIDFVLPVALTVDVKTARNPRNLLHEQGKSFADIYVLAEYDDDTKTARLLGWAWGTTLRKTTPKDVGGYGVISHYIPRERLRPMSELKSVIGEWRKTRQP